VSAPARLMRGAVCERIVLERGSILSVRAGGGPAVLIRVTDLRAGTADRCPLERSSAGSICCGRPDVKCPDAKARAAA